MQKHIIGIDVSARTLDVFAPCCGGSLCIANDPAGIRHFLAPLPQHQTIIALEHTGRYSHHLLEALSSCCFEVYLIDALHLKRSLGLVRGKSDRTDAQRIQAFTARHHQQLKAWTPCAPAISRLKFLMAERALRVKMKAQLQATQKSYCFEKATGLDQHMQHLNQSLVQAIKAQIKEVEQQILQTIRSDARLYQQYLWLTSVPGVGAVLSWMLLVKTQGFTLLGDARKMACYAGIAPFEQQSGSSVKTRPRVSHLADKALKKTLHLAAMSAIRLENDLSAYYQRKVGEGKNKMSVLNAVRNKILHRIYAVLKHQSCYQKNLIMS